MKKSEYNIFRRMIVFVAMVVVIGILLMGLIGLDGYIHPASRVIAGIIIIVSGVTYSVVTFEGMDKGTDE